MLEAWLLVLCRIAPVVALHPVFGARAVPRPVTIATAAALACAVAAGRAQPNGPLPTVMLREVAMGATVGVLGQAVFGAIEAAGRFVDDARGANVARLYSPQLEAAASPLGQLELSAALAVFWGLGLHAPLLHAVFAGLDGMPAAPVTLAALFEVATALARAALALAGPAAACCVLVDVLMGLVSRAAPSANVFLLSQPVKLAAAVLVTALGTSTRVATWGALWSAQLDWISRLRGR